MFSIYKICGVLVMQVSCSVDCCMGISPVNPDKEIAAQIVGSSSLTHYGIQQEESQIPVSSKHNLPWTLVDNKWWCYGPFKVFCYSTDIKVVNDDLDNIYRCYADCVKNECKDNDGNIVTEGYEDSKIVIDVRRLSESQDDYDESKSYCIDTIDYHLTEWCEQDITPTISILRELTDGVRKASAHNWKDFYEYAALYLRSSLLINNQIAYICKLFSDTLESYLYSIIKFASKYKSYQQLLP